MLQLIILCFFVDKMASPSTSLAKANSIFNLALFKQLSEDEKKRNMFYSPFSISSALAMVMLGARGNTAAQMLEVKTHAETHFQYSEKFSQS